jgi:hypothetical protein
MYDVGGKMPDEGKQESEGEKAREEVKNRCLGRGTPGLVLEYSIICL